MNIGSKITYYFILLPLSKLPLSILYVFSSFFQYLLFYLIPYRKKVVLSNLKFAFPEKSQKEIKSIALKFYGHLCDLIVEGVKLFSISEKEVRRRFVFNNPEILKPFYEKNQTVILVGGHYNNWEILAVASQSQMPHQAIGIYAPLNNKFFNDKFAKSRSRYGLQLLKTKDVHRFFAEKNNTPFGVFFGSDQSPTYSKNVYWLNFLGKETAVATGVEVISKKYNIPVIFGKINKIKRGYYSFDLEVLFDKPSEVTDETLITRTFTQKIEEQILSEPAFWLWSHKRWKRKRRENE